MKWNETRLVKNAAKLDWEGDLNTFAAELFSEIEKSNSWNFVSSLTFRGSWGLNLASNTIKLYTIRRRTLRRCQKYNKKVSKNFCIKSYDPLKLPRYFDPSTMSILGLTITCIFMKFGWNNDRLLLGYVVVLVFSQIQSSFTIHSSDL